MKLKSIYFDSVFEKRWHKYLTRLTEKQKEYLREHLAIFETFEFLEIITILSFLRKQESSPFKGFIDSRFRGNDKKVRFSKVSSLSAAFPRSSSAVSRAGSPILNLNTFAAFRL